MSKYIVFFVASLALACYSARGVAFRGSRQVLQQPDFINSESQFDATKSLQQINNDNNEESLHQLNEGQIKNASLQDEEETQEESYLQLWPSEAAEGVHEMDNADDDKVGSLSFLQKNWNPKDKAIEAIMIILGSIPFRQTPALASAARAVYADIEQRAAQGYEAALEFLPQLNSMEPSKAIDIRLSTETEGTRFRAFVRRIDAALHASRNGISLWDGILPDPGVPDVQ